MVPRAGVRGRSSRREALTETGKQSFAFLFGLRDQVPSGDSGIPRIFHNIDMDQRDLSAERTCKLAPNIGRAHGNRVIIHGNENFSDAQRVPPRLPARWRLTMAGASSIALIQINSQSARKCESVHEAFGKCCRVEPECGWALVEIKNGSVMRPPLLIYLKEGNPKP